jgi:hypothetical protein
MWSEMREREEKERGIHTHLSTHSRKQRKKRHNIKKMGYHAVARARRRRRSIARFIITYHLR